MNKDIFLTNSLGNKKEKFIPINEKKIGMYVCGPTVYDDPHIGNARPLVIFDILYKVLKCKFGSKSVRYVRNITDIDDKIIQSSIEKKISISDLTTKVTSNYHDDCKYLKCEKPNDEPKATENISLMINMIEDLIKKNYAYEIKNHVYFEVKKFKDYGKLSNKKLEELIAGSRVEISENKKNPEDFVLWKPSNNNEPYWESPWGKGRPGWHLECSVMSRKYLGDTFDIHAGGVDLVFPHHENEMAQSQCANGLDSFAKIWMHNGFLTIEGEKMSKSIGNIVSVRDLLKENSGETIRLCMLMTHYRQPINWTTKSMKQAKKTLDGWYSSLKEFEGKGQKTEVPKKFIKALADDLNTPRAISILHELSSEQKKRPSQQNRDNLIAAGNLLGFFNFTPQEWFDSNEKNNSSEIDVLVVEKKILERDKAREAGDFSRADKLRNELTKLGVVLEDGPNGTKWRHN
ncbi:MAG: cysteine--tRNA ligase [Alphaproteobacteria bacterium]|nr:cysteine--tRNA ligase [Alphaproteobacteria bacterium]